MQAPPKTILVATDFSEAADHALSDAIALARATGGKITVLHAYSIPAYAFGVGHALVPEPADLADRIVTANAAAMDGLIARYEGKGVDLHPRIEIGDPRDAILDVAKDIDADLIVVGTHGRRGLKRMALGSVAESVVRTAPCPVLSVHRIEPPAKRA